MPTPSNSKHVLHIHDAGKTRLKKLVQSASSAEPKLPLVHSTDTYRFDDVLSTGAIVPKLCPVFKGELLTYLFYGRPAYRPNSNESASNLDHYLPVCIIFRRDFAHDIKRVFPFDTGAYAESYYESFLHKDMKLGDFSLDVDPTTPGRVIDLFFGSVPDYLRARPSKPATLDPSQFEATSYSALINVTGSNVVDNRSSAIELQMTGEIKLAEAADAIVLPSTFAAGETGRMLKKMKIKMIPYDVVSRFKPNEYTVTISTLCKTFYIHKKIVAKEIF